MPAAPFLKRHRLAFSIVGGTLLALLIAAILLLSFGWAWLRAPIEQRLSARFSRRVTIGSIRRIDHGFLHPVLRIAGVHIAQPAWVGGGDMVYLRTAEVRLPLLPLLVGAVRPSDVTIDGLSIALVRRDSTYANWKDLPKGGGGGGGSLRSLIVRGGVLSLDDHKRDHRFLAHFAVDAHGLRLAGAGSLVGNPSQLSLTGGPLTAPGAWPFRFDYRSAIANGTLIGHTDHPLDLGHFDAHATAWGDDLKHLDLLVEAGLPGTQPARLTADLRHDRPKWTIKALRLHVGRSEFDGDLTIDKQGDRTKLAGVIVSPGLDFDDLSTNEGKARAAAKRRLFGPRIVPDTKIRLDHLRRTDGTLSFDVRHFLSDKPNALRALKGQFTLDHGILTADPLQAVLTQGVVTGKAVVRHQSGLPALLLDLRLGGSRLGKLTHQNVVSGTLQARIDLAGQGDTVRAAIGRSNGRMALVARDGALDRRIALLLGADAGRALFSAKDEKATLRCAIAAFDVHDGIATAAPLLIDTDVAQTSATGTIDLHDERLNLALTGHPKLAKAVSVPLDIHLIGILSHPEVTSPAKQDKVGTALKLIGNALGNKHVATVGDANCDALAARALR